MKRQVRRAMWLVVAGCAAAAAGCNTFEGLGKDLEQSGSLMQALAR